MRVRISYSADGAIDPCAVATYGETEDYTVNITQGGSVALEELTPDNIIVYPNPTSNEFSVDLSAFNGSVNEIQLLDLTGRVIATQPVVSSTKIYNFNTSHLANGSYYIKVNANNRAYTKRLVKN